MKTKVHMDRLINHLNTQIKFAKHLSSEFVYITRIEAEACLELAEAQEQIENAIEPVRPVVVEHEYGTEYKCGNCNVLMLFLRNEKPNAELKKSKSFCASCGKKVLWE